MCSPALPHRPNIIPIRRKQRNRRGGGEKGEMMALVRSAFAPTPSLVLSSPKIGGRRDLTLSLGSLRGSGSLRVVWAPGSSLKMRRRRFGGAVCYAGPFSPQTLQWISAISCGVLMLVKGTAIQKSFLVPLFALQAPASVISWVKGEYGTWTAFLALLVRLFYFIPGELELPFLTMLLVIVAPYQTMDLRGNQPGAIISLAIAAYLAFQHFTRMGRLQKAFDEGSIFATIAIVCITIVTCLFLF